MRIEIHVDGRPAPQGSKQRGAAGQLREASHYLPAWRSAVKIATFRAYDLAGVTPEQLPLFRNEKVVVEQLSFRLGGNLRDIDPPDLDKLTRATWDALTQARVWDDDARVVEVRRIGKRRPLPGEQPGADIIISTYQDQSPEESENVKRYRLDLIEVNEDPSELDIEVVSVTGPASVIAVMLPHVASTLGADAASVTLPAPTHIIPADANGAPAPLGTTQERPKRTRRTKAQIAADEAALSQLHADSTPPAPATLATPPAAEVYNPFAVAAGAPVGA